MKGNVKLTNIDVVVTATFTSEITSVRKLLMPILHQPQKGLSAKIGYLLKDSIKYEIY